MHSAQHRDVRRDRAYPVLIDPAKVPHPDTEGPANVAAPAVALRRHASSVPLCWTPSTGNLDHLGVREYLDNMLSLLRVLLLAVMCLLMVATVIVGVGSENTGFLEKATLVGFGAFLGVGLDPRPEDRQVFRLAGRGACLMPYAAGPDRPSSQVTHPNADRPADVAPPARPRVCRLATCRRLGPGRV